MRPEALAKRGDNATHLSVCASIIGELPCALAFVTCFLRGARAERRGWKGRSGARTLRGCLFALLGKRNGVVRRGFVAACARTQLNSWKGIHMLDPLCITEGAFDKHVVLYESGSSLFFRKRLNLLRRRRARTHRGALGLELVIGIFKEDAAVTTISEPPPKI